MTNNMRNKWDMLRIAIFAFIVLIISPACHVIFYESPLFGSLFMVINIFVISAWTIIVAKRTLNRTMRKLFIALGISLALWYLCRLIKYKFVLEVPVLRHYFWYGFYIPIIYIPIISFLLSICILRVETKPLGKWNYLLILATLLILLVFTNDLHQQVFKFKTEVFEDFAGYTYGWGYNLILASVLFFSVLAVGNIIRKCTIKSIRKKIWIPSCIVIVALSYVIFCSAIGTPKINGISAFDVNDAICFAVIAIWESFMQIGIISMNYGFGKVFNYSNINAIICDNEGNVKYAGTRAAREDVKFISGEVTRESVDENIRLHYQSIRGGVLYYSDDFTTINRLNAELEDAKEVIAGENTLIEEENALIEKDISYRTMNQIYDEIAVTVRPKILKIDELLLRSEKSDEDFSENISRAAVINAYVKRRSNLVILGKQKKSMEIMELYLAIHESLEYLSLRGIDGFIMPCKDEVELPSELFFKAYDYFENFIEAVIDDVHGLMVNISGSVENQELSMRITTDYEGDSKNLISAIEGHGASIKIVDDDGLSLEYKISCCKEENSDDDL